MMQYKHITYDWKQGGNEEEWIGVLEAFGFVVIEDPVMEGTDTYGYFIMRSKPTLNVFKDMVKAEYNDFEEWGITDDNLIKQLKKV